MSALPRRVAPGGLFLGGVLALPAARLSRELDQLVIETLRTVKACGGDLAFDRAAAHVITATAAILARERGCEHRETTNQIQSLDWLGQSSTRCQAIPLLIMQILRRRPSY